MKAFSFLLCSLLLIALLMPGVFLYAQATSQDVIKKRAELEVELSRLEHEIETQRSFLIEKQRESTSLLRDIAIFDARIRQAELSIRQRNLVIQNLQSDINAAEGTIDSLSAKLLREKESLGQLIRKTREIDSYSIVEIALSNKNLSGFLGDIDSFASIKESLQESFSQIEATKKVTSQQKEGLETVQGEKEELRRLQQIQKNQIEEDKQEKNDILEITKGEEERYQEIVKAKQKDAATIRSALFALRGSEAIPFERALDLAVRAFEQTGVRPALILGVIEQESKFGENVGQCVLTNQPDKGDGKGINTGRIFTSVMKPSRDVDIFLNIAERLGFDPFAQVVSCPPSYGYGGAMGPAQFIPSTWVLFEERIAKLTGHNPPNPWDPEDAFMASALLLRDNGAAKGGYTAERLAALRYFAGWANANKTRYAFYGNSVMELAQKHQQNIDFLQEN
ncbi:MAG: hypothetical protein WD003_00810 [Candidatus Paceibacterota bacterium]